MLTEVRETLPDAEVRPPARLMRRIENEYREMPGLKLTEQQAQRLWGLDAPTCRTILVALTQKRFLMRTAKGMYIRAGG